MALSIGYRYPPFEQLKTAIEFIENNSNKSEHHLQTFQMHKNTFPVPTTATGNFTAQMNHIIRVYHQTLVQGNLLVR